jgi:hypothetical protein
MSCVVCGLVRARYAVNRHASARGPVLLPSCVGF